MIEDEQLRAARLAAHELNNLQSAEFSRKQGYDNADSVLARLQTPSQYVIVRTASECIYVGEMISRTGSDASLRDAKKITYCSLGDFFDKLSEASTKGVWDEEFIKFSKSVPSLILTDVTLIIECTEEAKERLSNA